MKFPEVFVNVITTVYKNHWARLKVNGHVGTAFRRSNGANGLLQGLPSSCPLWLIYVEPLLRYLQCDPRLHGCTIPGPMGRGTMTRKLGAYADDIDVWCNSMQDVTYLADTDDGPLETHRREKTTSASQKPQYENFFHSAASAYRLGSFEAALCRNRARRWEMC